MSFRFRDPAKIKALTDAGFTLVPGDPVLFDPNACPCCCNTYYRVKDFYQIVSGPDDQGRGFTNASIRKVLTDAGFS